MSVKVAITRLSAEGEQINIEYSLEKRDYDQLVPHQESAEIMEDGKLKKYIVEKPGKSLYELLAPYFKLTDDRMIEMNQRIMASNYLVKRLGKEHPEAYVAFQQCMEVFHGRNGPATAEAMAMAKAEYEEARAKLEAAEAAAKAGVNGTSDPVVEETLDEDPKTFNPLKTSDGKVHGAPKKNKDVVAS